MSDWTILFVVMTFLFLVVLLFSYFMAQHFDKEVAKLKAQLALIANFADPDSPAGDDALEADRAWKIIYQMKNIAGWKQEKS